MLETIKSYTVADYLDSIEGYCEILIRRKASLNNHAMYCSENQEYEALYHTLITGVPVEVIDPDILAMQAVDASATYHKEMVVIVITAI